MREQLTRTPLTPLTIDQWLLTLLVGLFSCAFFYSHGSSDMDRFWLGWMQLMEQYGTFRAVTGITDYPAGSLYLLYLIKSASIEWGISDFLILKFVLLVFLFASTTVFYRLTQDFYASLLVHMMLLLSSVMLGYLDILYTPFLLLSLWALKQDKLLHGVAWFCVCCAIKYQPLILGPFYAIYCWNRLHESSSKPMTDLMVLTYPIGVYLLVMLLWVQQDLFLSFYNGLLHSRLSFQGLNAYWAYTQIQVLLGERIETVRGASPIILYGSRALFAICYGALCWRLLKRGSSYTDFLLYAMTGFYTYFIVISGVHENHLYVAVVVAMVLYMTASEYRSVALFVFFMNMINLVLFNGLNGSGLGFEPVFGLDMSIPIALVNTLFFLWLFGALMRWWALPAQTAYRESE